MISFAFSLSIAKGINEPSPRVPESTSTLTMPELLTSVTKKEDLLAVAGTLIACIPVNCTLSFFSLLKKSCIVIAKNWLVNNRALRYHPEIKFAGISCGCQWGSLLCNTSTQQNQYGPLLSGPSLDQNLK